MIDREDVDASDKSDGSDLTTRSVVRDVSARSAMCPPFCRSHATSVAKHCAIIEASIRVATKGDARTSEDDPVSICAGYQ